RDGAPAGVVRSLTADAGDARLRRRGARPSFPSHCKGEGDTMWTARRRAILLAGATLSLAPIAIRPLAAQSGSACGAPAQSTAPARFGEAMTYAQFVSSDSSRRAEWAVSYERGRATAQLYAERARRVKGRWHLLVVAESWCGDALNSVPYLARLTEVAPNIDLRLLRKLDASDLLLAHLTDGRAATPLVLVLDESYAERGAWVEQPAALRALIARAKGKSSEEELTKLAREWYAADGGRSVIAEVLAVIERAAPATVSRRP
ncbi:MAG TPA: thioredoxin family protein, partial [Gemmatimonadaceae bacterium]|nr:thioredoxin family protein [Gemmatimonadaceae bacterium]